MISVLATLLALIFTSINLLTSILIGGLIGFLWGEKKVLNIQDHLMAGQSFIYNTNQDTYSLLSSWWHGKKPEEKKKMVDIVDSYDGKFTVDCLKQLNCDCSIPMKEMQFFASVIIPQRMMSRTSIRCYHQQFRTN